MEADDPESRESDQEDEEMPENEDLTRKGAGEEEREDEASGTEDEEDWHTCSEDEGEEEKGTARSSSESCFHNPSRLLHKDELLDMFRAAHNGPKCKDEQLTVGLVGKKSYHYNPPQRRVF